MRTPFLIWFALVARALGFLSALPAHTHNFDSGSDVDNTTLQGVTFSGAVVTVGGTSAATEPGTLASLLPVVVMGLGIVRRSGNARNRVSCVKSGP